MWGQFVERKEEWIGGKLIEVDGDRTYESEITDIDLTPNGEDSAYFKIHAVGGGCGFDVGHGGIDPQKIVEHGITFGGPMGARFAIQTPDQVELESNED